MWSEQIWHNYFIKLVKQNRPFCISKQSELKSIEPSFWEKLFLDFCIQIIALFVNLVFLGQAFTIMLVYVWSRRNPYVRMNFFGLLTFKAPFLPWVLFGFSLMLGNSVMVDLIGKTILLLKTIHEERNFFRLKFCK